MRRTLTGLLCAALAIPAAGALVSGSAEAARTAPLPRICAEEERGSTQWATDLSRMGEGVLRLDGRDFIVRGEGARWRFWDASDPAFGTRFHSMMWLVPGLARGLPVDDILLEREEALPDPGFAAGAAALRATGWNSGMTRLRMGTVACLYVATGDERLGPVMDRLVAVSLDPYRYRGAPINKVHNQGTLANIALLEAARVFDRPEWRQAAIRRVQSDAASVFAPCGMSAEQSTTYHRLNVNIWRRSLAQVGAEAGIEADMEAPVRQAALAIWQLTRPDGLLEAIGTGNQVRMTPEELGLAASEDLPTQLLCPDRGWAANRSSWDDTATHYVLRFGPRPALHGHEDRGALTWFTQGVPVFSDRGVFDRSRGPRWDWAHSAQAHSTFHGIGTTWRRPFKADFSRIDGADVYRVRTAYRDTSLERVFTIGMPVDDTQSVLHVADTGRSKSSRQWYQRWQLAEGWRPLERSTAWEPAAVHERTGLFLYGTCWSGIYMRASVRDVETFPAWRVARPAHALECGGLDTLVRMQTLWVVSPVEGVLTWDVRSGEYAVGPPQPDPLPEPAPEPEPAPDLLP